MTQGAPLLVALYDKQKYWEPILTRTWINVVNISQVNFDLYGQLSMIACAFCNPVGLYSEYLWTNIVSLFVIHIISVSNIFFMVSK